VLPWAVLCCGALCCAVEVSFCFHLPSSRSPLQRVGARRLLSMLCAALGNAVPLEHPPFVPAPKCPAAGAAAEQAGARSAGRRPGHDYA